MEAARVKRIFQTLEKANPNPKLELNYNSPFELLVAVVLSARSTDKSVNNATEKLFAVANTPQKMLSLGLSELKKYIRTIGLYNNKASNLIKTCQILIDQYNGRIPNAREELEELPGVGRKSANVILSTAFGQPVIAVDTHIFRVANRTGLAKGKTVTAVEEELEQIIPQKFKLKAHLWLLLHGRYICTARNPKCSICPIRQYCDYLRSLRVTC